MNAAWVDGTSIVSPIGVAAGGRYHYRCRHKRQPTAIHRRLEPTSTHARHHRRTHSLSLFSSPTSPSSIVFVPPSPLFLPSFAMVVALRLMRMGNKHRPVYRISVADSRRVPTGKFIEHIGTYDPHLDKMGNKMVRKQHTRQGRPKRRTDGTTTRPTKQASHGLHAHINPSLSFSLSSSFV